jgi:hypothetical protein
MKKKDMLCDMFDRQTGFMNLLKDHDRLTEWPVDLTTKMGQRLIKEYIFSTIEELAEASFTLKNRTHKLTDDRELDFDHFKEELIDAMSFLMEVWILSGLDYTQFYDEYIRKNNIVVERLNKGY